MWLPRVPFNLDPSISNVLLVKWEVDNEHNHYAVLIVKNGEIVGHLPQALSKVISFCGMTTTLSSVKLMEKE